MTGREVSDAEAERFCELVNWSPDGSECKTVEGEFRCVSFRDLAKGYIRAADAARPVGREDGYRLLRAGEVVERGDQCLRDDCETWTRIAGWEVGMPYRPEVMVPVRRTSIAKATGEAGGGEG